jgi:hypothetical protein
MMLLIVWIGRPVAWNAAFSTFFLPCLGFLFLPITTMVYVWLMQGIGQIGGADWLWLILAHDIATIGASAAANRDRIPAGVPGSLPPQQPPAGTA